MKLWTLLTSLAATVVLTAAAVNTYGSDPIALTKHNMNAVFGTNTIQDNQICLPCHAPHNQPTKTDTLWNHVASTNTFSLYTTGNDTNGKAVVESALVIGLDETSKKCLSCHDGSVAIDSYGGYTFGAGLAVSNFNFKGAGAVHMGTTNDTLGGVVGGNSTAAFQIGAGGDLTHDHPVGVAYPSSYNDPTLWTKSGYTSKKTGAVVGYVNAAGGAITTAGGGFVLETVSGTQVVSCGSCHTPHTNTYNFLAISNNNSQLCLTCHAK